MTLGETTEMLVFAVLAIVLLFTAIMMIASKEIVHSALYLLASFAAVAGIYILTRAAFLGIVQIFVYIGAIGVLILFAVMLTTREVGG
ncbi:MAG: NADH-quinone oxidoreductase subunit J [Methanosarcinales archaeon]|nr:NADH-quinone oxidoreductase subunit J [Methanosarcinales archaeon]